MINSVMDNTTDEAKQLVRFLRERGGKVHLC